MSSKNIFLMSAAGLMMAASMQVAAVEKGQMLADNCLACHGAVSSNTTIPNLSTYPSSMIVSQMKAFRDGERSSTVMSRHAKGYTDDDITAMANYIGVQGQ